MAVWSEVTLSGIELTRIDAEFYKPEYLVARKTAGERKLKSYGTIVLHPAEFTRRYSDVGHFVLLAQNNRDNYYDWSVKQRLAHSFLNAITRNRLEFGDVTITRTGANYGQTSVIGSELEPEPVYACADLLILRSSSVDGHLVSTYLNSTLGKLLINRGAYGAAQPHIAPKYVKEIPFPSVLLTIELEIRNLILTSRKLSKESSDLFAEAQQLLNTELGLNKLVFQRPVSYTTQFSKLGSSRRSDAEYFDPTATAIVERIKTFDHVQLASSFSLSNGFPWYSKMFLTDNSGEPVVRIRNIRPTHIDVDELTTIDRTYANKSAFPKAKKGDVVIGMDGIKYFYASILDGECYVNQRVAHLIQRPSAKISPEYATFIINSRVGQAQLLRDMTIATTVGHITNRNIAEIMIPFVSNTFHQQVTSLVRRSIDRKQESKQFLEKAKARVEQLIEEAVRS